MVWYTNIPWPPFYTVLGHRYGWGGTSSKNALQLSTNIAIHLVISTFFKNEGKSKQNKNSADGSNFLEHFFTIRANILHPISLLYKILPTNLGVCKPTFLPFVHHIWGKTGTVFIIQTLDRMQYFTILSYKITLVQYWAFS